MESPPPPPSEAARVALGSGVVLAAGIVDKFLRLATVALLARGLGAGAFGLYTVAVTTASLLGGVAPIGLNAGVVLFTARHATSGDRERLKGLLVTAIALAGAVGGLLSAGLVAWASSGHGGASSAGLLVAAPAVALTALQIVVVAACRGVKDLHANTIGQQIAWPAATLAGCALVVAAGGGAVAAIGAYTAGCAVSLAVCGAFAWRRFGPLLRDRSVAAVAEPRPLLAFSLPQAVADVVYRVTTSMDVLLLGQLAGLEQVGLYRVAASLAALGALPTMAVQIAVSPVAAELFATGRADVLAALVRRVTRWLVLAVTGPLLVVLLVPDALLGAFHPAYVASAGSLVALVLGQAVFAACSTATPLVTMQGRSRLEMANGLVAAVIGLALHLALIPPWGGLGAAIASAVSLAAWGALRVAGAWWTTGIATFERRTVEVVAVAAAIGLVAVVAAPASGHRYAADAVAVALWAVHAASRGITPEDRASWGGARRRLRARLGRRLAA